MAIWNLTAMKNLFFKYGQKKGGKDTGREVQSQ